MQRLFSTLSEKDKRRYAGIEATKLGHGGIDYISKLFDIDPKTIRRGIQELELADDLISNQWGQALQSNILPYNPSFDVPAANFTSSGGIPITTVISGDHGRMADES